MKLPAGFLLAILICLAILAQIASPQQSGAPAQQPASSQEAAASNPLSGSDKSNGAGRFRKIKVKMVPEKATAQCEDLTFSFSEHVSGTCAKHGGVKKWLKPVTSE